jgi:hypothetical protein
MMPEIYLDSFQHTALVAFDIALDLGAKNNEDGGSLGGVASD